VKRSTDGSVLAWKRPPHGLSRLISGANLGKPLA
jgi:hypothetical protein